MSGFTPVNQVRLTNVATVKLQKKGKRFEIACYRNKVLSWRSKVETDLGEVLQIDSIFANVSKGMLAAAKDLQDVFGTTDHRTICKEILDKGELQVSEQERVALNESILKDIASIVADKTINPETGRPYTVNIIQNAMKSIQFSVNMSKSSKSQALEVIRKLREVMPIARANMLLRVVFKEADRAQLLREVAAAAVQASSVASSQGEGEQFVDYVVDPEAFRRMEEVVSALPLGGRLDVLQLRMTSTGPLAVAESKEAVQEEEEEVHEEEVQPKGKGPADRGGGGGRGDELQTLLRQMGALGSDHEEEDEEVPAGPARVTKKNKKPKATADEVPAPAVNIPAPVAAVPVPVHMMKAGKKSKRSAKEDKEEAAAKAKQLHDRIARDKALAVAAPAVSAAPVPAEQEEEGSSPSTPSGMPVQRCNTCGGAFADPQAYREHFRSEWHRFNLKRKMKGLAVVPDESSFLALSVEELQI